MKQPYTNKQDATNYRNYSKVATAVGPTVRHVTGSVRTEMLVLMYKQATDPSRPRVNPTTASSATGPLHNAGHFVGLSVFQIASHLTKIMGRLVPAHDVTHTLYDLRDAGLVRFHPTKDKSILVSTAQGGARNTPRGGVPVRIQLTAAGVRRGEELASGAGVEPQPAEPMAPQQEPEPVPVHIDVTQVIPGDIRDITGPLPPPQHFPEPTEGAQVAKQYGTAQFGNVEPPEPRVVFKGDSVDLMVYPLVHRLYNGDSYIKQAASALRMAGQNDLASMAGDALKERTQFEQQVNSLVKVLVERGVVLNKGGDE